MRIHFIGIGGIGVSALARYFLVCGDEVSGSDAIGSGITKELEKLGAKIFVGHHQGNPDSRLRGNDNFLDLVIYSAAVQENNPELIEARKQGIKCQKYAEALGEITREKFTIAVSGMHGKSTTTAMVGLLMEKAGFDPTVIVGTKVRWNLDELPKSDLGLPLKSDFDGSNFRMGHSQYLVIEADEYDRSFLNYWPKILVLLNIEEEHLDTYAGGLPDILKTFSEYVEHLSEDGTLVVNEEDQNIQKIFNDNLNAKFRIEKYNSKNERGLKLRIPGRHNLSNANAALSVAKILGISDKIASESLSQFNGTWRRMEYKGEFNGARIYDDYGHHPTEIRATLDGARELISTMRGEDIADGRLRVVFQPHQYQRTHKLFGQFLNAFNEADETIILPIYSVAGREKESIKKQVSSEKLVEAINNQQSTIDSGKKILFMEDFDKAVRYLQENLRAGDICVIMGAGDIYKLTGKLL